MNIIFKNSNTTKNLYNYRKLYKRCFNKNIFEIKYLNWLYNKNPSGKYVGIDCFDNDDLIGQVGGIPVDFFWKKKKIKIIISINVCVDKNYRKQNLFNEMAIKFEKIAKKNKFDGIIAIGNKSVTPAWMKSINLNNLGELDVFLGLGKITDYNFKSNAYDFYTYWDKKKLSWRLNNPKNKTILNENEKKVSIYSKTQFPLIKAYAPMMYYDNKFFPNKNEINILQPFIFVGLIGNFKKRNMLHVPKFLKPSPLNFLYKFFNSDFILKKNKIFFTFMDFDIF